MNEDEKKKYYKKEENNYSCLEFDSQEIKI